VKYKDYLLNCLLTFVEVGEQAYLVATMERVSERLEAGGMACQLQYPHDAHDAEDLHDAAHVLELLGAGAGAVQAERQIERQDCQHVDEV